MAEGLGCYFVAETYGASQREPFRPLLSLLWCNFLAVATAAGALLVELWRNVLPYQSAGLVEKVQLRVSINDLHLLSHFVIREPGIGIKLS